MTQFNDWLNDLAKHYKREEVLTIELQVSSKIIQELDNLS